MVAGSALVERGLASADDLVARPKHVTLETDYRVQRARVDTSYQRVREIVARSHRPLQVRDAARELTLALRAATATATRALQEVSAATAHPSPRHRPGRRRADRRVPGDVRRWSAELVRLAEIAVWLRRTTLDEPGVHIPTTVRVASYAATGPHVPGLGFGGDVDAQSQARIGIDLAATIDGAHGVTAVDPSCPATGAHAPGPAKAA